MQKAIGSISVGRTTSDSAVLPGHTSAHVLHLASISHLLSKLRLQDPPEDLKEDFKAGLCHGGVVAALAELVTDERVLSPGELMPAKGGAGSAQGSTDDVAPGVRDVRIPDAEDEGCLTAQVAEAVKRMRRVASGGGGRREVRPGMRAERATVDVGGEVAY